MKSTARPCRRARSRSSTITWAWMVTSRAVVGSSAMTSFGSQESAMAIMARWSWPPETWWGYLCMACVGSAMRTSLSASTAILPAAIARDPAHAGDGIGQLPADGEERVQRLARILEDHRRHAAAQRLVAGLGRADHLVAVQPHAARDPAGRRDEAEAGERGHRLAAARFPHQPHHLALEDGQIAAPNRLHIALEAGELDAKAGDLEEDVAHVGPSRPGQKAISGRRRNTSGVYWNRIHERQ